MIDKLYIRVLVRRVYKVFVYTNRESITTQVFTHWVQTMPGKQKIKKQREDAAEKGKNHENKSLMHEAL